MGTVNDLRDLKNHLPNLEYLCLTELKDSYTTFGFESESAAKTKLSKELGIKCVASQPRTEEQDELEAYANKQIFVSLSPSWWVGNVISFNGYKFFVRKFQM